MNESQHGVPEGGKSMRGKVGGKNGAFHMSFPSSGGVHDAQYLLHILTLGLG